MIIWITGNSGSGKTTLANQMKGDNTVVLDGDVLRKQWGTTGFSKEDRWEHNIRVAKLAKELSKNSDVIVAVICPYRALRDAVKKITGCSFIYLTGGKMGAEYPYEVENKFYFRKDEK